MYNKAEILKKYNLSEEEFYKKFPTPEDYHKYENGGQLSSKKKYVAGGGITPIPFEMPKSLTTPTTTFTPSSTPNTENQGNKKLPTDLGLPKMGGAGAGVGSLIGGLVGGGGALLASGALTAGTGGAGIVAALPTIAAGVGIGSAIGGAAGGVAGMGVDAVGKGINKLSNQEDKQKFQNGGLINFKGNTHENGGIALPDGQSEVEDGETKMGNFIFSNNLLYNRRQTFADKSKRIDKKYFRDNDKIDAMGKKLELEKLSNQQENMKKLMMMTDLSTKYMNGGRLKKKYKWGTNEFDNITGEKETYGNQVYGDSFNEQPIIKAPSVENYTMTPESETTPSFAGFKLGVNKPSDLPTDLTNQTGKGKEITGLQSPYRIKSSNNPPKPPSKFDFKQYGNLAGQLVGDGYNVLQGLKGGDPVDFQRIQPNFVNSNAAIKSFDNTARNSFNAARNAVRNNATSSAEYLGFMSNLANKESMTRGLGMANIKSEYDKVNTGVLNRVNEGNAQIQMAEADAQQREVDAARSAVSRGLSDIGSKIGSFNNENSARNNQNNLINLMSSNGYKLITGKNGELSFEKDGQYVPYNVAIKSVLEDK